MNDKTILDALAERAHVWRPAYEISSFTGEDVYTTRRRLTALVLAGLVRRDGERYVVADGCPVGGHGEHGLPVMMGQEE